MCECDVIPRELAFGTVKATQKLLRQVVSLEPCLAAGHQITLFSRKLLKCPALSCLVLPCHLGWHYTSIIILEPYLCRESSLVSPVAGVTRPNNEGLVRAQDHAEERRTMLTSIERGQYPEIAFPVGVLLGYRGCY